MTRGELRASKAEATSREINDALGCMDRLWAIRLRPGMNPDYLPELGEINRARILAIRDRANEILRADREAKEGKRAA